MKTRIFKTTTLLFAGAVAAAGFGLTSASAQPAYTAEEIVQKFIASANLGKAKRICIGSEQECSGKSAAPIEPVNAQINFEYDSDVLTPDARETIVEFAKGLKDPRLEIATFEIEGHTDAYGGNEYNMELSERRAARVTATLVSLGVAVHRIKARGMGESRPKTANPFDAENRRVEARMILGSE